MTLEGSEEMLQKPGDNSCGHLKGHGSFVLKDNKIRKYIQKKAIEWHIFQGLQEIREGKVMQGQERSRWVTRPLAGLERVKVI